MKTVTLIRPASVDIGDKEGNCRYITALFSADGFRFESEPPMNSADATSINNMIALLQFPVLPPPLRFRGLFQ